MVDSSYPNSRILILKKLWDISNVKILTLR